MEPDHPATIDATEASEKLYASRVDNLSRTCESVENMIMSKNRRLDAVVTAFERNKKLKKISELQLSQMLDRVAHLRTKLDELNTKLTEARALIK